MTLFSLIGKGINLYLKHKQEGIQEDSNSLAIKKRALFHDKIPDLVTVKNQFGNKYNELKELIEKYDPVKTPSLKKDPDKYQFLTKTLIYQLKSKKTKEDISNLTKREFKLWFNNTPVDANKFDELLNNIYDFKIPN
jgi:predicted GTPase